MKAGVIFSIMIVLLSAAALAYTSSNTVNFEDQYFYEIEPKIIADKDIYNANGDCIRIKGSEWVIIRNNHIHDCNKSGTKEDGYAVYIEDVENLVIDGNMINNSYRGIYLKNVKHVTIKNNRQTGTYRDAVFSFRDSDDIKVFNNYAKDNGASEVLIPVGQAVGVGDGRLQGIVLWNSNNAEIYGNTIINSSSDGIGIAGATREHPETRSHGFKIYNNTLQGNGEQGIWTEGAQDGEIYDNHIMENKARPGFGGGSSGIMLDFDTQNFTIRQNTIESNDVCGIVIKNSPRNFIDANKIRNNKEGGICLDGETVSLKEYHFVGNMENRIYRNTFSNNSRGNIRIWTGSNDATQAYFNNFDTAEEESITSSWKEDWRDELILKDNNFKKEDAAPSPAEEETPVTEEASVQEEVKEETQTGGEMIILPESTENDSIIAYSLLTLLFVIIIAAIVLFSVRKSIKKK